MLGEFTTEIGGALKLFAFVDVVEPGVRGVWHVGGFEADGEAEGLSGSFRFADKVPAESSVGERGVGKLLGIGRHRFIFCGDVARLAFRSSPFVEVFYGELFAFEVDPKFSGEGGEVAGFAEEEGVGFFEVGSAEFTLPEIGAVGVFVFAGEDAGSAGHTDRGGDVVVVEGDATGGKGIEIRRDGIGVAVASHADARLVIGEEEDDIWWACGHGCRGEER